MTDSETTLADLRRLVEQFVDERDWHQFHTPKNLAMSLAIEAAEVMEHFQWLTAEQSRAVADEQEKSAAVGEELADVLCYVLAMANELGLDLATALREKIRKNEQKYPAPEYRGRFGPEDPGPGAWQE
jgi:NTP pyrophosphatase (non-canonical NTP hydrolase)